MYDDDLDRRLAKGTSFGGHCQFEAGGEAVHLHVYALDDEASSMPASEYRFVAGPRDVLVSAGAH